ncbi:glutamine--fructose-6-phosphate transaminase (isomerizing) [Haloquadratum walsbyi]|uniref:Glutamine--fructose-6-phosphate aminotransferase [isomerizing] n=1 Tax=Haloquadratum walsbyi (strain DSM 16854 / JCM 12705 / C23) TaxID=768065 RepID=G0LMD9_HALWC|nr:glutamine--fructose-6-phosphate transaminase (isomerizing) [Haloquadratum walsbyi]CCC41259.1 glutamine--fructose-6-phosphate aminotransferase (isomerizing) [Haloquadratum walsbyi C23]
MCGIIGCVNPDGGTREVLMNGLANLDYRGYDSAGIAVADGGIEVAKREGEIDRLQKQVTARSDTLDGPAGIGHTRWSTHGPPTDANAHPHTDGTGDVAVVHNGIIENYQSIRDELEADGVEFVSETDTEVVPHLISKFRDGGADPQTAFRRAVERITGSYALAVVFEDHDAIFATRDGSPLVIGVDEDAAFLASDVPAFLEYTRDVIYLEDGQFATLRPSGVEVTESDGTSVDPSVTTVEWSADQTAKSGYDHFMAKEIHEQPASLRQCLRGRVNELSGSVSLEELSDIDSPGSVQLVACGTSYHAALYVARLFRAHGVPAQAYLASEYVTAPAPFDSDSLLIGITQSGETADTLSALRKAQRRGASTLAVTNVVGSTAARECDHVVYIRAGPEIGVAATKTFSSQLATGNLLVERLCASGTKRTSESTRELIPALRDLPNQLQSVIDNSTAKSVVEEYLDYDAYFFIGRGLHRPVALEGALKFKEITYEHAEGFAAGELKHGPLALVTQRTPIFAVVTGDGERAQKTISNIKEVQARDAPVVAVTDGQSEVRRYANHTLEIPQTHPRIAPVLANTQLQLVAYHMADRMNRSIDKPRNLAKSVTVE